LDCPENLPVPVKESVGQTKQDREAMIAPALTLKLELEIENTSRQGFWRFIFWKLDGSLHLQAEDWEPETSRERLELLALVRALESLEHPSVVILAKASSYLEEGIRFGLPTWRSEGWRWEYFEHSVPIRHQDLWQRLDWDLRFHRLILPSEQRGTLGLGGGGALRRALSVLSLGISSGTGESRQKSRIDGPSLPAGPVYPALVSGADNPSDCWISSQGPERSDPPAGVIFDRRVYQPKVG
jgi:ribonuclease HI